MKFNCWHFIILDMVSQGNPKQNGLFVLTCRLTPIFTQIYVINCSIYEFSHDVFESMCLKIHAVFVYRGDIRITIVAVVTIKGMDDVEHYL